MNFTEIEYDEMELTVGYYYDRGTEGDDEVPGTAEGVDIVEIKEMGVDVYKDFTRSERDRIEEILCNELNIKF